MPSFGDFGCFEKYFDVENKIIDAHITNSLAISISYTGPDSNFVYKRFFDKTDFERVNNFLIERAGIDLSKQFKKIRSKNNNVEIAAFEISSPPGKVIISSAINSEGKKISLSKIETHDVINIVNDILNAEDICNLGSLFFRSSMIPFIFKIVGSYLTSLDGKYNIFLSEKEISILLDAAEKHDTDEYRAWRLLYELGEQNNI